MHTTLISPAELAQHLDDPAFLIVDCRFKLDDIEAGRRAYFEAHIPGALYAHLDYDLSGWTTGANGRHPLPSDSEMATTFSAWGVAPQTQVVAYDDAGAAGGLGAARLWWMLHYLGHAAAAVLEGGWAAWLEESGATQDGLNSRAPAPFAARPQPAMRLEADALLGNGLTLVDSRAPSRYRGDEEPIDRVAGHIPGALNFYWGALTTSGGRLLPKEELRARLLAVIGDAPPDRCVFYCGSGVSAAANLLAMEAAGLPGARLYPGSWSEWSSDPARPVATGPQP